MEKYYKWDKEDPLRAIELEENRGKSVSLIWKHTDGKLCGLDETEAKILIGDLIDWLKGIEHKWKRKEG